MTTVLDRYLLKSLLVNYLIGIGVMLSLYVVLDLFVNMDEFTEKGYPVLTVAGNIVDYYLPNLALYFAQLGGIITLFACGAVLARLRKFNEITAMLASGVSLYRIARPILLFAVAATGLLVLATEVVIPAVAHKLARKHDEADGSRAYEVLFLKDGDALVSAERYAPASGELHSLLVIQRDASGAIDRIIEADRATWEPPTEIRLQGQWRLDRGRSLTRIAPSATMGPREGKAEEFPTVYRSSLGPREIAVRQAEGWMDYLSLAQLDALQADPSADRAAILRTRHARVVLIIMSLLLVALGLPFFLDRSPANILADATKCAGLCGLCYVTMFVAQSIRLDGSSAFVAWAPVFIFGTLAMVHLDRVRT